MDNNNTHDLNLARKWRPRSFDQIVGQEIPVRMLKNSLYLKKYFPVYLFAGQRGCGKTSTARVFASAVNCAELSSFQQNPAGFQIPCLNCESCRAMARGSHPDFIEIDAASHTGVDNVRQIIDSSSYMPLTGQKKVYLIDEAHMLSKAAFNAFLKILEEPPASVLFILATTELHKVPATVLSRCFQVVFTSLESGALKSHLRQICDQEHIDIDDAAVELVFNETEGSARDAINLLERVRFSGERITEQTVLKVLGKISNKDLFELFKIILEQQPAKMLTQLSMMAFETISPQILWDMVVQLCRALLWVKYGVRQLPGSYSSSHAELKALAEKCSLNRLHAMLQLLWTQEELFLKTNKKHLFLESVLLQLCEQVNILEIKDLIEKVNQIPSGPAFRSHVVNQQMNTASQVLPEVVVQNSQTQKQDDLAEERAQITQPLESEQPTAELSLWGQFIQELTEKADNLLVSILLQAVFVKQDGNKVVIQLSSGSSFFTDKIEETRSTWQPILSKVFVGCTDFFFQPGPVTEILPPSKNFNLAPPDDPFRSSGPTEEVVRPLVKSAPAQASYSKFGYNKKYDSNRAPKTSSPEGVSVNIQDKDRWPLANLLIKHFPGKIKALKNNK